jgi:hypothetical protein
VRRSHEQQSVDEHKRSILQAEHVLAKMVKLGMTPDEKAYSLLLREYLARRSFVKVVNTTKAMQAAGMQPEVVLNAALRDLALREREGAPMMLEAMTAVQLVPDLEAYDALVRSFLLRRRFRDARKHADAMVAMGMRPTEATYHTWLQVQVLASRGTWDEVHAIMQVRVCARV